MDGADVDEDTLIAGDDIVGSEEVFLPFLPVMSVFRREEQAFAVGVHPSITVELTLVCEDVDVVADSLEHHFSPDGAVQLDPGRGIKQQFS